MPFLSTRYHAEWHPRLSSAASAATSGTLKQGQIVQRELLGSSGSEILATKIRPQVGRHSLSYTVHV